MYGRPSIHLQTWHAFSLDKVNWSTKELAIELASLFIELARRYKYTQVVCPSVRKNKLKQTFGLEMISRLDTAHCSSSNLCPASLWTVVIIL